MTITQKQKKQLNKIAKKHKIIFAVIFGSQARGIKKPESDLDIAALLGHKTTYKDFCQLFLAFSDIFPGYNVDLRFLDDAGPGFRFQVMHYAQFICGDRMAYLNYKAYAYKDYIDCQKMFKAREQALFSNIKNLKKQICLIKI